MMATASNPLPPSIRFIERDWLCANHVMFRDGTGRDVRVTLLDSGYGGTVQTTLSHVRGVLKEWGASSLHRVVNTHIHSDHIGGNAELLRQFSDCRIAIPAAEAAALNAWDSPPQMLSYADQQAEAFQWHEFIEPGQTLTLGGEQWQTIATPGHDMGSLVLYAPRLKTLISADALWESGAGFVPPQAIDPAALPAQRATFERLAALDVAWVIPGHGAMFSDFRGALKRASDKLEAFANDDLRVARSVVKGMFVYSLMWRGALDVAALPEYVRKVGVHRDYNAQFFKMSDEAYAHWLIDEAVRTGKIAVIDGQVKYLGDGHEQRG